MDHADEQMTDAKIRAGRNRTLILTQQEKAELKKRLVYSLPDARLDTAPMGTICGDCLEWVEHLPGQFVDMMFLDPPYNLTKNFHGVQFKQGSVNEYTTWLDQVIGRLKKVLKKNASVYICGDWYTSASIFEVAAAHFTIQNRITWEREKGRGARKNWKNCSEDIWFCTLDKKEYTFNADSVRLRRRVIAPYRNADGTPKDWRETAGGNFRDTAPSNLWTDITIPFWSMPENTDHPTQKSEKLLAKLILASSHAGDVIFDPFLGSGTTSVVAKKLGRRYLGIDVNEEYCLWAEKRLMMAEANCEIQGYADGVFWERNTLNSQPQPKKLKTGKSGELF